MGGPVTIVCKPTNTVDRNTIEVVTDNENKCIGYVVREKAATLAPFMDKYFRNRKVHLTVTLHDLLDSMSGVINVDFVVKNNRMTNRKVMLHVLANLL